jgi:hypothetical protein
MPKQAENKQEFRVNKKTYNDFVVSHGKLVYKPTGEIVSDIAIILDHYNMTVKMDKEDTLPTEYFYNNWNRSNKFTKLYQIEPRILNSELSLQARGLLFVFMTHLVKSTNEVVINGHRPSNRDLVKATGVSNSTLMRLFIELEELNIIKRIGGTTNRAILVNPYLCFNGKNLAKSTLDEFKIDPKSSN